MIIIYTVRDHMWQIGRVLNQTLQIDIKIFVTPEFLRLTCNILDKKRDRQIKETQLNGAIWSPLTASFGHPDTRKVKPNKEALVLTSQYGTYECR